MPKGTPTTDKTPPDTRLTIPGVMSHSDAMTTIEGEAHRMKQMIEATRALYGTHPYAVVKADVYDAWLRLVQQIEDEAQAARLGLLNIVATSARDIAQEKGGI